MHACTPQIVSSTTSKSILALFLVHNVAQHSVYKRILFLVLHHASSLLSQQMHCLSNGHLETVPHAFQGDVNCKQCTGSSDACAAVKH